MASPCLNPAWINARLSSRKRHTFEILVRLGASDLKRKLVIPIFPWKNSKSVKYKDSSLASFFNEYLSVSKTVPLHNDIRFLSQVFQRMRYYIPASGFMAMVSISLAMPIVDPWPNLTPRTHPSPYPPPSELLDPISKANGKLYFGTATDNIEWNDTKYDSVLNYPRLWGQYTPANYMKVGT